MAVGRARMISQKRKNLWGNGSGGQKQYGGMVVSESEYGKEKQNKSGRRRRNERRHEGKKWFWVERSSDVTNLGFNVQKIEARTGYNSSWRMSSVNYGWPSSWKKTDGRIVSRRFFHFFMKARKRKRKSNLKSIRRKTHLWPSWDYLTSSMTRVLCEKIRKTCKTTQAYLYRSFVDFLVLNNFFPTIMAITLFIRETLLSYSSGEVNLSITFNRLKRCVPRKYDAQPSSRGYRSLDSL